MIPVRTIGEGVFVTETALTTVGAEGVAWLKTQALRHPRQKARLCAHPDAAGPVHEMLIVHGRDAYVRPHRHHHKVESYHLVEGQAQLILFTEEGRIARTVQLGKLGSGRPVFCRVAELPYHTLRFLSEAVVFHETTRGPFRPEDTIYAPWASAEDDTAAVQQFLLSLEAQLEASGACPQAATASGGSQR